MIILDNVTKKYDEVVVDKLSLKINKGELFGLLGPNGAGKTTTIRMIMALTSITSGNITVNGYPVNRNNIYYKAQIGLVPQHNNLEPELTVKENLKLHGMLYKMDKNVINKRIKELLEYTELLEKENLPVNTLSGGMKRKLMIARALMHNPAIILLDEPTVGLDVFSRRKVWDLIRSLQERGETIVLTTHYLEEAEALCSRIGLLKKGRLLMSGSLAQLREKVGPVVVELFEKGKTTLFFFKSHGEAIAFASDIKEKDITIRQTKLEDVFVKLTQEKSDG